MWRLIIKRHALYKLKRYEEAIVAYDKAIELKSDYAEAYAGKGNVHNFLKQYDAAIQCCDKAIELDSKYPPAYCL